VLATGDFLYNPYVNTALQMWDAELVAVLFISSPTIGLKCQVGRDGE